MRLNTRYPFAAGVVFLACAALYYFTRSPALDEWDSVQFALGVGDFNLWRHQPHPPGYPLYVAAGWLGQHLLGLDVHDALSLGSALGGGLFVAGWFVLFARRFSGPVAALAAVALAGTVNTWMCATKVITDPLGAGLIALSLVFFDDARIDKADARTEAVPRQRRAVWLGGLAMAAAVGVRPQNFGIGLLIVLLGTFRALRPLTGARERLAGWAMALGAFFTGCLLWLVPVLAIQAHTPESAGNWLAYINQLVAQWRWRLDQPKAFVGAAGGQSGGMMLYRLDHHLLGWFTRGFGFSLKSAWGWLGLAVIVAAWVLYILSRRGKRSRIGEAPPDRQAAFWWTHLPWAVAYILMIFCCLPGDQRYYLPVFPLFVIAAVAGPWAVLDRRWRWVGTGLVVVAVILPTLPLIGPNHRDEPPPVRLLHWLQEKYPTSAEKAGVILVLRDTRRHAQWYAPGFRLVKEEGWAGVGPGGGHRLRARLVHGLSCHDDHKASGQVDQSSPLRAFTAHLPQTQHGRPLWFRERRGRTRGKLPGKEGIIPSL